MLMECLICSEQLKGEIALCDRCAESTVTAEWHTERRIEGLLRMLEMDSTVALIEPGGVKILVHSFPLRDRVLLIPVSLDGYAAACMLFNALMEGAGQKLEMDQAFIPPSYDCISPLIKKLEELESRFPGRGMDETYLRLGLLYLSASRHSSLPLVSDAFNESVRGRLLRKANDWLLCAKEDTELKRKGLEACGPLEESTVTADMHFEDKAPSKSVWLEEPPFIRHLRNRARVQFYAGEYENSIPSLLQLSATGFASPFDLNLLCFASLRLSRNEIIDNLAFGRQDGFNPAVFKAAQLWRMEMWGKAVQLLERDIEKSRSSIAFVFQKMLCRQYRLTDKLNEMKRIEGEIEDMQLGVNTVSEMYLSIGMWGAALQCLRLLEDENWDSMSWAIYGKTMEEKGDRQSASKAYERALEINPVWDGAYVMASGFRCSGGDHRSAASILRSCPVLMPSLRRLIAKELNETGDWKSALQEILSLLNEDPDDRLAAEFGVAVAEKMGQNERALMLSAYLKRSSHG